MKRTYEKPMLTKSVALPQFTAQIRRLTIITVPVPGDQA